MADFALPLLLCVVSFTAVLGKPQYCVPSNHSCWPTQSVIDAFASKLDGALLTPNGTNRTEYMLYVNMTENLLHRNQYPSFIMVVQSVSDIQECIRFASEYHIQVSIMSTGHSWSGRSTANDSLQINLSQMTSYMVNDTDPEHVTITVETGLRWGQMYQIADSYGHRMIIGGADPSVGPGGYSLGGGHSPISPAFGLSSDFTVEYFMVDANANIVHVYNTSGANQSIDDLFWALRGGGGGTFGVVINITFLLHNPVTDSKFTQLECEYSFFETPVLQEHFILDVMLDNLWQIAKTNVLDSKWGGYFMVPVSDAQQNVFQIALQYYGDVEYAKQNAQVLLDLNYPYNNSLNHMCQFHVYDTFEAMWSPIPPFTNGIVNAQVFNDLIPAGNLSADLTETMVGFFNSSSILKDGFIRCMTSVLLGGAISSFGANYTSVHPGFRNSWMELGLSLFWTGDTVTDHALNYSNEWEAKLQTFGFGIYSNEENYECDDCDWQAAFWGTEHYQTLLKVKQQWDPNQVFWCHHCVGDV